MSIQTRSGLPAHCPNTTQATAKLYTDFRRGIEHLRGCDDFDLLFIPRAEDFFKFDVKNNCHPIHHELVGQRVSAESDEEDKAYIQARFNNGIIDEDEYRLRMQEFKVKEMKRQLVFDKSVAFRDEYELQQNILEEYKRNQDAVGCAIEEADPPE